MSLELNRTIVGDCRDTMRQLIAEGLRVQTCVTSPPYWGLRDYGVAGQLGLEWTVQEYVDNMVEVFGLVRDLLADNGTLWLNIGDTYAGAANFVRPHAGERANRDQGATGFRRPGNLAKNGGASSRDGVGAVPGLKAKDLVMMPARVAFALQADGWYLRQDIIWHKPNPMPESVTDRCTKAHEYLFLLSKSERYYFDAAAISEPATYAGSVTDKGLAGQKARNLDPNYQRTVPQRNGIVTPERRNKRSVWTVASQSYSEAHFATFPPALMEPCILAGSRIGDVVFDPFMGSGTTGQVAQDLGRRWIGCELNPEYVELERKRTAQQSMILDSDPMRG